MKKSLLEANGNPPVWVTRSVSDAMAVGCSIPLTGQIYFSPQNASEKLLIKLMEHLTWQPLLE